MDIFDEASEGAKRVLDVLSEESRQRKGTLHPHISGPLSITLENVCFSYTGEYSECSGALHDFSLTIEPGQSVAIVGESGAGKTTIIIAYRLSTVRIADKIVVMDQGRKVEEGTPDELVALSGLYAKMVALQSTDVH